MKKVKYYAEVFNKSGLSTGENVPMIMRSFVHEMQAQMRIRGTDEKTRKEILQMLNKKWISFARLVKNVKTDGFKQFIIKNIPDSTKYFEIKEKRLIT